MHLPPLTQAERYKLRDLLNEIASVLKRPPFDAVRLEDQAEWLRAPDEAWPSKALLSNAYRPDSPTAFAPSRRFFRRVKRLHHAVFHEWIGDGTTILRFANETRIIAVARFDPYDPSPLKTKGDLQAPGDVLFLDGNHHAPNIVLIMGSPEKVIECEICGKALYKTTWNRKYHHGECREIAAERRREASRG